MSNLGDLFRIGRQYGQVDLYTQNDGLYSCVITFQTIPGAELKARSGGSIKTPEEALQLAIDKAVEIINSISEKNEELKRLNGK